MKQLLYSLVGFGILALTGCQSGTTTAPSTNPQKPEAVRALEVKSPGEQNIVQDQTDKMSISISRSNFDGPVAIEVRDLPKGISVVTEDLTIPAGKSSVDITLKATPDATPVDDHPVTIAATAKEHRDMKEAVTRFNLDVKPKK